MVAPTDELYYVFVGGDVLDAPYCHKVTFTPERTVGDACPYKIYYDVRCRGAFRLRNLPKTTRAIRESPLRINKGIQYSLALRERWRR